jgi:hypothetical protein
VKRWLHLGVVGLVLGALPAATAGVGDDHEVASPEPQAARPLSAMLQRALDRSHAGLHELRMPDGSARMDLDGRFKTAIAVRVGPAGVVTTCVATREEAERFLNGTTPHIAPEADR